MPALGDLSKMKIGQKVLVMGNNVFSSIFEGLNENKNIDLIAAKSDAGGLVLNLDGEALGIALSGDTISFASIDLIAEALKTLEATL